MESLFDDYFQNSDSLAGCQLNDIVQRIVVPNRLIMADSLNGYAVYACEDSDENYLAIRGVFVRPLVLGQTYQATGKITTYRSRKQLAVTAIFNIRPVTKKGIISYLQTLDGLKSKAHLIYEAYGNKSIDVLMNDPLIVAKRIKGLGKKSVTKWANQLEQMRESQHIIMTLLDYGLTQKQAKKLYDRFKQNTIKIIEDNPYYLAREVKGFGFIRCDEIARAVGYNPKSSVRLLEGIMYVLEEASREGHCFLPTDELVQEAIRILNVRLDHREMEALVQQYVGQESFEYALGEYVYPVNCEELANSLYNYENERNKRKRISKQYVLVPFSSDEIIEQFQMLYLQNRIIEEDGDIYLTPLYEAEKEVAQRVLKIALTKNQSFSDQEKDLDLYLASEGIKLELKQREAILKFSKQKGGFYILNGSAGCGKTFTLKIILKILAQQYGKRQGDFNVLILAPTGKASKVASKATGIECVTVHRGLKYNPHFGFAYNEQDPFDVDCVVLDESSMMDIRLTCDLLRAIRPGTKVIFIGDTKQLPSVGAGNVLQDLIQSGIVDVVTLDVVKRQGETSGIIRNANRIINDEMIGSCPDTKDAYVIRRETPWGVQKAIIESVHRLIKTGYNLEDIQVLCPQKESLIGTYLLNYLLQKEFNPNVATGKKILNRIFDSQVTENGDIEKINLYFCPGDKVIHIKNNYDMAWYIKDSRGNYQEDVDTLGITNGECGVIEEILEERTDDGTKKIVIIRYEDKYVKYEDGVDDLDLAWSLTFHKCQGSQFKAVIIPIMNLNYNMLDNNLLYTGYTRAEEFSVVVGQESAIRRAIQTHRVKKRHTKLAKRIQEYAA